MASGIDGGAPMEEEELPPVFEELPLAEVFQCISIYLSSNL